MNNETPKKLCWLMVALQNSLTEFLLLTSRWPCSHRMSVERHLDRFVLSVFRKLREAEKELPSIILNPKTLTDGTTLSLILNQIFNLDDLGIMESLRNDLCWKESVSMWISGLEGWDRSQSNIWSRWVDSVPGDPIFGWGGRSYRDRP